MSAEMPKCPENVQETSSREELLLELGGCLKRAREAQELTIEEIVLSLKLRSVYLHALESGDWDEMPGEVYAIGFLKQYANYLNIDVSESVELLKTGDYTLTKPLTFPDPPIAPNKSWVIIAALAFIVLFILFNLFDESGSDRITDAPETSVTTMSSSPSDAVITSESEADTDAEESEPLPVAKKAVEEQAEPPVVHHYRLSAVGADVWLQLSSPDEPPLLIKEALLKTGESINIEHISPFLLLTCGNAAALQVEIDGRLTIAAGSLGKAEKVLRNFKLTTE